METQKKKLSLIVFSGDFDRALAAFTLATGAAAVGWEVDMFFTFWGLSIIKKHPGRKCLGRDLMQKAFNFLLGGANNLPLSRLNFAGLSPILMTGLMRKNNVATLSELIQAAKSLKVTFFACEMAMQVLGINRRDLDDDVRDVVGVATFLERSKDAQVLFL